MRDRYFGDHEEEVAELRINEEQRHKLAIYSEMVASEGWKDFRARMDALVNARDVQAGNEGDMLYQIGRRDGLRDVVVLLRAIEQELRDEQARGN